MKPLLILDLILVSPVILLIVAGALLMLVGLWFTHDWMVSLIADIVTSFLVGTLCIVFGSDP